MVVVFGEGTKDGLFGSGGLGELCGCCAEMSCSGKKGTGEYGAAERVFGLGLNT